MSQPSALKPTVVIIASPELAQAFNRRLAADPAVVVFDASASLRALETIRQHRPMVVLLDASFAITARGAVLVQAIKADRSLASLKLRVLSNDVDLMRGLLQREATPAEALLTHSPSLERIGTRSSVRMVIRDAVHVTANGEPSRLVDLSTTGAQVVTNRRMRPEQQVRLTLDDGSAQSRLNGVVAWAVAEPAGARLQYRAGLRFVDPDTEVLGAFCRKHSGQPGDRRPEQD
jgi:hypothetical protein